MAKKQKNRAKANVQKKDYKLDVLGFFQADAADILASRTRSQYIHRGGNIRSAGDEVEVAVRNFFGRRLPASYTVHHGHFVDKALTLSKQCDVIIADHGRFPVMFRGQDGLEYLPYEGVYAYGEIKSSLEDKHLDEFIKNCQYIQNKLHREDVPSGYIDEIMEDENGLVTYQPWPERGHLYRFLFAVSSDNFDIDKALKKLCDTDPRYAPNIICLLDKGVIEAARAALPNGVVMATYTHPQKQRSPKSPSEVDGWAFSSPNSDFPEGATLFSMFNHLLEHLKNNVLVKTNYIEYISNIVTLTTKFVHRT